MINTVGIKEHLAEEQEAERLAKEKANRQAEEVKKVKAAEQAIKDTSSDLYVGGVNLVLSSPVSFRRVKQFEECLKEVDSLRLVWSGGSVNKGTIIAISAKEPIPLISILKEMPRVEKVDKKGKKITVVLKALALE